MQRRLGSRHLPGSATIGTMSVPSRVEAAALLRSFDPPPWFLRHSRAVAEIAAWLAARATAGGHRVDRSVVEAAALLHDIDKLLDPSDPARHLPHGDGSAAWLDAAGHPELAPAVAAHPVVRLGHGNGAEAWLARATLEERIVAYADKRAGQRLEPVDARFASWERRYPPLPRTSPSTPEERAGAGWDQATLGLVRGRVARLERDVCSIAGTRPEHVRRLAWTGAALRAGPTGRGPAGRAPHS